MKNKYLSLFIALMLSFCAANAASDKVHVYANSEFKTAAPAKSINVTVISDTVIGTNALKAEDVLHCNVVKITNPKRGKRAASFTVCPVSYTSEGETKPISGNFYGKYSTNVLSKEELKNVDAMKVGKKAAISVGNHFVKGIAPAIAMAEGMVKNEEGNRIQSGVKQVYKDSPLSYVEKGKDLVIEPGDSFYLVFKPSKSRNSQEIAAEVEADDSSDEE